MDSNIPVTCLKEPTHSEIVVYMGPETDSWLLKITEDGFVFNREKYPQAFEDDFARAFCEVLEHHYNVKFTRKGFENEERNE